MYANVEVQHATSVHNSLARTSHTSDALSTYHTGTGKRNPKMRLDRNNEWTAIITASVFMTKCSEEQKKKYYLSFPYVPLSFCTLKQIADPDSWWKKRHMRKDRSVACPRLYLIMPTLRHLDDIPEWICCKNIFVHSFNIDYHRFISLFYNIDFKLFGTTNIIEW